MSNSSNTVIMETTTILTSTTRINNDDDDDLKILYINNPPTHSSILTYFVSIDEFGTYACFHITLPYLILISLIYFIKLKI